jgi:hypothetical protein
MGWAGLQACCLRRRRTSRRKEGQVEGVAGTKLGLGETDADTRVEAVGKA